MLDWAAQNACRARKGRRLPRYFFHVRDEGSFKLDEEGTELANVASARDEGMRSAKMLVAEALLSGKPLDQALAHRFEIADETGETVLTVLFSDAAKADDFRP